MYKKSVSEVGWISKCVRVCFYNLNKCIPSVREHIIVVFLPDLVTKPFKAKIKIKNRKKGYRQYIIILYVLCIKDIFL